MTKKESTKKEKTMTPIMTDKRPEVETSKNLTQEDLKYLKQLNEKTKEIKGLIGELEISKIRLVGDFNTAVTRESEFINQMYAKYNIQPDKDFNINPETGEIKVQDQ